MGVSTMFSDGNIGGPLHDYQLLHHQPPSHKRRSTMHKKSSSVDSNLPLAFDILILYS
jgi:hypothetical protein